MFNRPPRIQKTIQENLVELVSPPQLPTKPKINWVTVGLPVFASGLVIALMFFFASSTSGLSYLMFLPFILASVGASVFSYRSQTRDYEVEKAKSLEFFKNELREKKERINHFKAQEIALLEENSPSPEDCVSIVERQEIRIGERRPQHLDFLTFRLGLGIVPSHIQVKGIPVENRDPVYKSIYKEADQLISESTKLEDAPVFCDLKEIGCLGVVGQVDDLRCFGWAAAIQLLTHHWPAELNITSICSFVEVENWRWLNQVQHHATIFPDAVVELRETESVKQTLLLLEEELRRRKSLITNLRAISSEHKKDITLPAQIIIFDRISDVYNHAAFSMLLKEGRELGAYGIFLMDQVEDLPAECGAVVNIRPKGISYQLAGDKNEHVDAIDPDETSADLIRRFAARLGDIKWLIPQQVTEPPEMVGLLELFPYVEVEDMPLERWWSGEYPYGYLRSPIGKFSPSADLIFDLNDTDTGYGPHGLIGGMTGSGKSELLKTLILSFAMTHHPYDLNFALIDYKGGGALDEFRDLPHVVGIITDIQNHADYGTRVVQSLSWEVKRREKLLADARTEFGLTAAHIDEYRTKLKVKIPIPRLVIIFDEFAEFQERHQEESKKLINIARVGRSLGIHLIICTQNPMGKAVDQQVRDNSNFTICLRVRTPETSKSLINIPDAVQLRRGEAYFHINGPQKFKVAYGGWDFTPSKSPLSQGIAGRKLNRKYVSQKVSEAQAIIEEIHCQALEQNISKPPAIWPDPLIENLSLISILKTLGIKPAWNLNSCSWERRDYRPPEIPLGLIDDPLHQQQPAFLLKDHLLIFGPSGAGKSVALLTLAKAIGLLFSPTEAYLYCIDITGQSPLKLLKQSNMPHLPRIGGIIHGNDIERINRLFKIIRTEIQTRSEKFTDIRTYNSQIGDSDKKYVPYIYLLIDGINQQFNATNTGFKDQLDFVMRHGAALGIFVILTGNLQRDIPEALQADTAKLLLQSSDRGSILSIAGRAPDTYQKRIDAGQEPNPGRGLINSNPALEMQCAFPMDRENASIEETFAEFELMGRNWKGDRPTDVDNLSLFVPISQFNLKTPSELFIVGKGQESLDVTGLSLAKDGPLFLISSMTSGLGKTSALRLWLAQLVKKLKPEELKLVLIDYHTRTLRHFTRLPHIEMINSRENIKTHITKKEDLKALNEWLRTQVNDRKSKLSEVYSRSPETFDDAKEVRSLGHILVAIDDYEAFINTRAADIQGLIPIIIDGEDVGVRCIVAEDYALLGNDELMRRAKKYGCGLLLGGSEGLSAYNDTKPPYNQKTANLPAGRGYLVRRGQAELVQAAMYWELQQEPTAAIMSLLSNPGR